MEPDRVSDDANEVSDDGSQESPMKQKPQEKSSFLTGMKSLWKRSVMKIAGN
jgi:hypothetical protein